jgi:molybdopterin-biosynthesis enzyme MoeA-like protein
MKIGLIVIGDEILSGRRQDVHLRNLIGLLRPRGLRLSWARYVGDEPTHIVPLLQEAFASGDLVFSCGGIGATPDDHTRRCAGAALGRPMVLHPEAKALILQRIRTHALEKGWPAEPDHPETLRRLEMGVFPEGAQIVPNPFNQIPGFFVGSVYFLPGFPVMAEPMMAQVLDTHCANLQGQGDACIEHEHGVIVYGAMEATLTPLMEEIEFRFPKIKVFSLPSVDHPVHGQHIDLGVKGADADAKQAFAALLQGLDCLGVRMGTKSMR